MTILRKLRVPKLIKNGSFLGPPILTDYQKPGLGPLFGPFLGPLFGPPFYGIGQYPGLAPFKISGTSPDPSKKGSQNGPFQGPDPHPEGVRTPRGSRPPGIPTPRDPDPRPVGVPQNGSFLGPLFGPPFFGPARNHRLIGTDYSGSGQNPSKRGSQNGSFLGTLK